VFPHVLAPLCHSIVIGSPDRRPSPDSKAPAALGRDMVYVIGRTPDVCRLIDYCALLASSDGARRTVRA